MKLSHKTPNQENGYFQSEFAPLAETHCLAMSDEEIQFYCTLEPNHDGWHEVWIEGRLACTWPAND